MLVDSFLVTDMGRVDQHLDVRTINLTPVVDGRIGNALLPVVGVIPQDVSPVARPFVVRQSGRAC